MPARGRTTELSGCGLALWMDVSLFLTVEVDVIVELMYKFFESGSRGAGSS